MKFPSPTNPHALILGAALLLSACSQKAPEPPAPAVGRYSFVAAGADKSGMAVYRGDTATGKLDLIALLATGTPAVVVNITPDAVVSAQQQADAKLQQAADFVVKKLLEDAQKPANPAAPK